MYPSLDSQFFFNLSRSFPCGNTLIDWGHDYGGDLPFDHEPWHWRLREGDDEFGTDKERRSHYEFRHNKNKHYRLQHESDPFDIPLIKETFHLQPSPDSNGATSVALASHQGFSKDRSGAFRLKF